MYNILSFSWHDNILRRTMSPASFVGFHVNFACLFPTFCALIRKNFEGLFRSRLDFNQQIAKSLVVLQT